MISRRRCRRSAPASRLRIKSAGVGSVPNRLLATNISLVLLAAALLAAAAPAPAPARAPAQTAHPADPLADLWQTHLAAIGTLECTMSVQHDQPTPRQVSLRIDMENGWLRGRRVVHRQEDVLDDEFGRTSTFVWGSSRMAYDGMRRFDLATPDRANPIELQLNELNYYRLLHAFTPLHQQALMKRSGEVRAALISRQPAETAGREILVYREESPDPDSTDSWEYHYHVDLTDGARLYRMEVIYNGRISQSVDNSDFRRVNGVWIAHRSVYEDRRADGASRVYDTELHEISLNRIYTAADFAPDPDPDDFIVLSDERIEKFRFRPEEHTAVLAAWPARVPAAPPSSQAAPVVFTPAVPVVVGAILLGLLLIGALALRRAGHKVRTGQ